ncbi:RNA polymerase sigma factor [Micromonospora polyrhachis]|uniref:RNA polymerase sigma-70 factor (ECF subfamily) n=1 Tax=Micromonospora polyrhachis TaxID=1282883 RepID=A0A7W7SW49_9ACTN|nr:sigma-70 family RNA polymerase sigma factor [Micromonospora polyrhachis]MBB4962034.1 RNA polymerase sigma-70 factor (ECF subfamily) [Micromonospora polyrhachis]
MFESSYHLVLRYCYRRVGDVEHARELTQETFIVAWRRRGDMSTVPVSWLYGVARRVLADHWRAGRARPVTVPLADTLDACGLDGSFDVVELAQDLRGAFRRLSESDREVLRLVTWENLDLAGVAQALDCGRAAAAVRLFRARQRLARLLDAPAAAESTRRSRAPVRGGTR